MQFFVPPSFSNKSFFFVWLFQIPRSYKHTETRTCISQSSLYYNTEAITLRYYRVVKCPCPKWIVKCLIIWKYFNRTRWKCEWKPGVAMIPALHPRVSAARRWIDTPIPATLPLENIHSQRRTETCAQTFNTSSTLQPPIQRKHCIITFRYIANNDTSLQNFEQCIKC